MSEAEGKLNRRKVLIVEDEAINRILLGEMISRHYDVLYAENGLQALEILQAPELHISLVLLDLIMPVMSGAEVLDRMHGDDHLRQIPVIVLTSDRGAEVDSLNRGAADFLNKPYDREDVILARVNRNIELAEDRALIRHVERDELTGLYNKDFFFERVMETVSRSDVTRTDAIVLDIDHFHLYNELYGRASGNEMLRRLAGIIREEVGDSWELYCRCEADTFYLFVPHREDHEALLRRMNLRLQEDGGESLHLRMGVCTRDDMSQSVVARFDRARAACDSIRDHYVRSLAYYDEALYQQNLLEQRLVGEMREAIQSGQFRVFYQPKYDVTGRVPRLRSAEALIRWQHPVLGMVNPGVFIPLFENNGMITELDHYVWEKAGRQIHAWEEIYHRVIPVSVNVSRIDLFDQQLLQRLRDIVEKNRLPEKTLMLEITESAYTENAQSALETIHTLRDQGFPIEMDDFGSGYSSLNMLLQMPVDALKIDRGFMQSMTTHEKNQWLLFTLISIARNLNVPTIFEGVETREELELIQKAGGNLIQGFYFSRPLPPEQFAALIERDIELD